MRLSEGLIKYHNWRQKYGYIAATSRLISYSSDKLTRFVMKYLVAGKPLEDMIIFESQNDFDSNSGAFYDYLINNRFNQKYKIIWLIKNKMPDDLPQNVCCFDIKRPSIKKAYHMCTAKYYIFDHNSFTKARPDQISCYLTHGSFGLKAVKGIIKFPKDLDYYLAPSELTAPIQAKQFMLPYPNEKQLILGFPKHDILYSDEPGDLRKLTSHKYDKVFLWMPTFRKAEFRNDSNVEQPLGVPIFKSMNELEKLNDILEQNNSLLIIKIHPAQDLDSVNVHSLKNIMVVDGTAVKKYGIDVNRLMKDANALISDYSSAAYDYLHIGRPIAYTFDDLGNYKLGLKVDDPLEWIAGPVIYDVDDYTKFIISVINEEDGYRQQREDLFDKVYKYHDGNSSERLAAFLGITL